ncbi:MAG: hypothetical protein MJ240_07705 [Kiritimatiellae bacterium]|nr:hypothetical protein [Kiritimatiellia bacterium]
MMGKSHVRFDGEKVASGSLRRAALLCRNCLFVVVALCGTAFADEVNVGWHQIVGTEVPAGSTVQRTDRVTIDDAGTYVKTGAGTLEMPIAAVDNQIPSTVKVLGGTLKLTTQTVPARDIDNPPSVIAQAAFWVDATAGKGLVTVNGEAGAETGLVPEYVTKWLDRRETNAEAPTRVYAVAAWTNNTESPLWGVPPAVMTVNGRRTVYFGGAHSGQFMAFRKGASAHTINKIYDYFLVFGVTNCMGLVLGGRGDSVTAFFRTDIWTGSGPLLYPRNDVGVNGYASRHYLDGRLIDPYTATPKRNAFQLFNSHRPQLLGDKDSIASAFFDGYSNNTVGGVVGHTGGDYLCEVIVFTNRISNVQRLEVERYLMAKWNLPNVLNNKDDLLAQNTTFATASNATVEVEVPAGTSSTPIQLAGEGAVVKTGTGLLALGSSTEAPFSGSFDLQEGSVLSQGGPVPSLALAAGTRLHSGEFNINGLPVVDSAEYEAGAGTRTTCFADAVAGTVRKTGAGPARIRALAADVKKLQVAEGQLILDGGVKAKTLEDDGVVSVEIPNPSFERPFALRTDGSAPYHNHGAITAESGWTALTGVGTSMFMTSLNNYNGLNAWSTWCPQPCPDGTNVLYLITVGGAYTTVTIPKSGRYQFSALACARARGDKSMYNICDVFLGTSLATRQNFGQIVPSDDAFHRFYCRTPYIEAGTYVLGVRTRTSTDSGIALDDFRLDYIPDVERVPAAYTIPNGNFDDLDAIAQIAMPSVDNSTKNWTLSTETSNNWPLAHITLPSMRMRNNGAGFTLSDWAWNSAQVLIFKTGWAETTFTPPAGTYQLRGRIARWRGIWNDTKSTISTTSPGVTATLNLGGTVKTLGSVTAASELLSEKIWSDSFTVDGQTPVTLRLSLASSAGAVILDDFDLISDVPDTELLAETACETTWTKLNPAAASLGNEAAYAGNLRSYTGTVGSWPYGHYWGYNRHSGNSYLFICENGGVQQNVTIPKAGTYRLVYHERSRKDKGNGANPVQAWIRNAAGTYTNFISRSTRYFATNYVEYAYHFQLPAAGAYVLAFQGTGYDWQNKAKEDLESLVDGVSLQYVRDPLNETPTMPADLAVEVANEAVLNLNFPGTLKLRRLHLNGEPVCGHVDAATHPKFITGMGSLEVPPAGTLILFR